MSRISVSILGYNESGHLEKCLESVKWADEIVYVDCRSSDNSIEIAKKYTNLIFTAENNFNINVNKQIGIDKCSKEWILYLDPDEEIPPDLKNEILDIINSNTLYNGFLIPRKNYYFGKWLKYGGKYPDHQLRLFKNGSGRFPCVSIHERISIKGEISRAKNPFMHNVIKSYGHIRAKIRSYSSRKGEEYFRFNKSYWGIFFRAFRKPVSGYLFKLGILDGLAGFTASLIDMVNEIAAFFRYRELKKENGKYTG